MKTRIKNFILNSIRIFLSQFNYAFQKPSYITLDITHNCNLHCQHCHFWKTPKSSHITFDQFKIIIDKLKLWVPSRQLQITGGEPFLIPNILKMVKYAHDNGFNVHLNTNLNVLTSDNLSSLKSSGISSLSTSIDHYIPTKHNDFRGTPQAFEKTIDSINKIKNLYPDISVYINTVITNINFLSLNKLSKELSKLPVNSLNFQVLIPTFNTNESFKDLIKKNPLWPKSNKLNLKKTEFISNSISQINEMKKYYQSPLREIKKITCTSGHNNFIIDQKGDIRICFNFAPVGNIFTDNPKQIWNSKKAINMRKIIRKCQEACKIVKCNRIDLN